MSRSSRSRRAVSPAVPAPSSPCFPSCARSAHAQKPDFIGGRGFGGNGESLGYEVAALLRDPTVLTSVNAAEVRDQMVRVSGADPDLLEADLALLSHAGMTVLAVTAELGMEAGRIRARRYHRERAAVSLADCVAASATLAGYGPLATSDSALAAVVRAEGGGVHALPDSKGVRP